MYDIAQIYYINRNKYLTFWAQLKTEMIQKGLIDYPTSDKCFIYFRWWNERQKMETVQFGGAGSGMSWGLLIWPEMSQKLV